LVPGCTLSVLIKALIDGKIKEAYDYEEETACNNNNNNNNIK
jgi:hypothetical protein